MQLFNVCILYNVWLKIENYILRRSNVQNLTFDRTRFGFRIFDIRRSVLRMSNIRHSTDGRSNVENPTSDLTHFGSQIFDIRRSVLRMSNIRHSTDGRSNVENPTSDRTRFGCRIFDIRLCGRSNLICDLRSDRIYTSSDSVLVQYDKCIT